MMPWHPIATNASLQNGHAAVLRVGRSRISDRGDDVLIGGTTAYDANDAALLAILEEWNSGLRYADRVAAMSDDVGYTLQKGVTVLDDGDLGVFTGAQGNDWFFFYPDEDDVTDEKKKEVGN